MKKIITFTMIMILLASFAFAGISATYDVKKMSIDQGGLFYTYADMDSAGIDTSRTFNLQFYDMKKSSGSTIMPIPISYLLTAAVGAPKMSIYIDYSFDNSNWAISDTLAASVTSEALVYTTIDLNNKFAPYYRLRVHSEATGKATIAKLWMYLYWEREEK